MHSEILEAQQASDRGLADSDDPAVGSNWRDAWRRGAMAWLTAVAGYTMLNFFSPLRPPGSFWVDYGVPNMWRRWGAWDTGWYELIATYGYDSIPHGLAPKATAFYPLYPTLSYVTDLLIPGPILLALLIVSATAFLGFLVVFFRLIDSEFGAQTASRGIWVFLAFPSAFFLFAPYNMSLLLLLMVSSIYAMRQGKWWAAGILGGLAVLTRPSGLILVLPFAYEYMRQRDFRLTEIRPSVLWISGIPAGLGIYMAYCWAVLGDAFAPSHAQAIWTRQLDLPFMPVLRTAKRIFTQFQLDTGGTEKLTNVYDLVAVLFVGTLVVLGFVGPWKFRKDQLAFPILALGMFLFSLSFPISPDGHPPLMSAIRYVIEVFPAFIVLARITKHTGIERAYLFMGLTLQGFLVVQFLHSDWVA